MRKLIAFAVLVLATAGLLLQGAPVQAQAIDRLRPIVLMADYDLDATTYVYCNAGNASCASSGGWVTAWGYGQVDVTFQIDQMDVTGGIDFKVECQDGTTTSTPVNVYPGTAGGATNYTATGAVRIVISEPWYQCRVGVKIGSADDGADTTTHAEKLTAVMTLVTYK